MWVEILLTVIGIILLLVGIVGCVLPVLPGQVLAWASLLMLQLKNDPPFTAKFIIIWALVTAGVTILDYVVPIWGTKKLGGSKYGIWGAGLGLIVGIFFAPLGLIIGPFLGAFAGEMIAGKDSNTAFKSGLGSFIGFLTGTLLKLIISFVMGYYFFMNAFV
ncbi:MAG: DUF456 domain-containing protein [Bacteroidetes bacterium]|nr:MAG: DUF456 domain-containing protein [Bacteroidota bacterium]